ncbi:glyoxalase [Gemella sp. 19428wG2_WT2a]|nr:glyoxalase [Gemella sp. 19428wG2_WT2a]TFU60005.1 glyoxalase [Gemella sp. WT2a]
MLSKNLGVMLYVEDVAKEKEFWKSIGFEIVSETEMMSYEMFEMKSNLESSITFTVFNKEFIKQVSPEVVDNQPSVLFETNNLEELHKKLEAVTDTVGQIQEVPFRNFNFASPSGNYYAVKEVK